MTGERTTMSKIITRLFDSFADAEHAVIDLESIGVPDGDISLVAHGSDKKLSGVKVREPRDMTAGDAAAMDAGVGAAAGGVIGATGGVLAGLGLLAIPGLGPVIAAGWLTAAAVGALVGGAVVGAAGGLVGALTNAGVSKEEADVYAEGVRRGGTLISVKVADDKLMEAETVLNAIPQVDIMARGAAYREAGWAGFADKAPPYSDNEIAVERARYTAA
jgi:hypothetical protein